MTFDSVEPVMQGFCRIKNTVYKQEMKNLVAEGWILLKECKMYGGSNTNVYSLGQIDD